MQSLLGGNDAMSDDHWNPAMRAQKFWYTLSPHARWIFCGIAAAAIVLLIWCLLSGLFAKPRNRNLRR